MNTDTAPTTTEAINAEIAILEREAAEKRAILVAQRTAEGLRRRPLGLLLTRREEMLARIRLNTARQAAHASDALEWQRKVDEYFTGESSSDSRLYPLFDSSRVDQHAERAVALIGDRLKVARAELAKFEAEIKAEAGSAGLEEMLPPELK